MKGEVVKFVQFKLACFKLTLNLLVACHLECARWAIGIACGRGDSVVAGVACARSRHAITASKLASSIHPLFVLLHAAHAS